MSTATEANKDITLERSLDRLVSLNSDFKIKVDYLRTIAAKFYGGVPTNPPQPESNAPTPSGYMDRLANVTDELYRREREMQELLTALNQTLGDTATVAGQGKVVGR